MVTPAVSTAAVRMFSVAPTEGKSSLISAPCRFSASATTAPCWMRVVAPIFSRPDWCISSGREPIASPPGNATTARPQRAVNGPSTQTEARNCRTASKSASGDNFSLLGVVIRTVGPSMSTSQPSPCSTFCIKGTSRISGQLCSVVVPSANSAAAINFSTLFLAPSTLTEPCKRAPPVTKNISFTVLNSTDFYLAYGRIRPVRLCSQSFLWAHADFYGKAPMRRAAFTASYLVCAPSLRMTERR